MILLVHLRQALQNHSVSIDFHREKPHLDGNAEMDFFVHDINSYFMLGSIIPTNGEVEFRSMKILEIVLTEQICQVAFGVQTLRRHQKHEVMWNVRGLFHTQLLILKKINPVYSLEGLMLKLKCQYFGHLMQRVNSLEKTLILVKIAGKRRWR